MKRESTMGGIGKLGLRETNLYSERYRTLQVSLCDIRISLHCTFLADLTLSSLGLPVRCSAKISWSCTRTHKESTISLFFFISVGGLSVYDECSASLAWLFNFVSAMVWFADATLWRLYWPSRSRIPLGDTPTRGSCEVVRSRPKHPPRTLAGINPVLDMSELGRVALLRFGTVCALHTYSSCALGLLFLHLAIIGLQ